MPTPFMHLRVAERIRQHPELGPSAGQQMDAAWPAFYLGNIAPDFQTISDVPREVAHFYELPPARDVVAHEEMLERLPHLADASALDTDHAVFIAGYRAHLLLDLRWYWDILIPCFVEADDWPVDHRQRFLVHNTLLTYLDRLSRQKLPEDAGRTLAAAMPQRWLPFAGDGDLIRWRDMIAAQLAPGTVPATVSIYAERMRMSAKTFAANLDDSAWMDEQVFRKVSLDHVLAVIDSGVDDSVRLVGAYLDGREP
ncbi:MAG: zinc dependent phospholipase C family protein [Anaerolineae bacterium]|nr:zinc dependent phospholipase C family protein [Anaerolineae bacterium]